MTILIGLITRMPKISFSTHSELLDIIPHPLPAMKCVPDWYKNMDTHIDDPSKDVVHGPTLKSCMPVRDYMMAGYIIPSWQDIAFKKDHKGNYRNTASFDASLSSKYNIYYGMHDLGQVKGSPLCKYADNEKFMKLNNPWVIKTPKGYSTLFMSPFYQEMDVTILPAIVDTDTHEIQINFPFIPNTDDVFVEKGAPLVHAIPFKRDDWTSEVGSYDNEDMTKKNVNYMTFAKSIYTTKFWQRKRYR